MIHDGDIGTILEATVKEDDASVNLVGSTSVKFSAHPPGGTVKSFIAAFTSDGSDGKVRYTTLDGDINVPGTWRIQVLITFSASKILRSVPDTIIVGPRLDSA